MCDSLLLRIYRLRREFRPDHSEDLLLEGCACLLLRQLLGIRTHSVEDICVPGPGTLCRMSHVFTVIIPPVVLVFSISISSVTCDYYVMAIASFRPMNHKKVGAVIKYCESPKSDPVSGSNSGLLHARWSGARSCALYMLCVDFVKKVRIARTQKPISEANCC